jgi:hypothetical protein
VAISEKTPFAVTEQLNASRAMRRQLGPSVSVHSLRHARVERVAVDGS